MTSLKVKSLKPVMPRSDHDPVGAARQVMSAYRQIAGKIDRVYTGVARMINDIPREEISLNNLGASQKSYRYLVDANQLQNINSYILRLIMDEFLLNDAGLFTDLFFLNNGLEAEYQRATENVLQSTKNLASAEAVGADLSRQIRALDIETVLLSPGYQRRIGLVKARVFEEMKGLTEQMRKDLSGALGRGMAAGLGVNQIKRDIKKVLQGGNPDKPGGYKYRAERIARTEISNAYRTAYRDETDELNNTVWKGSDFVTRLLWYSALTPTTRINHAKRHGRVYTTQEVREFYSVDGNGINCNCVQVDVLVRKSTGEVVNKNIVDTLDKQRDKYLKTH